MSVKRQRLEIRIHHLLSNLFQRGISDPRLTGISVMAVDLDSELRHARVSINALGFEDRKEEIMMTLSRASGYLRREIGQAIRLKHTPELHFQWDTSLQKSARILSILEGLKPPKEDVEIDVS